MTCSNHLSRECELPRQRVILVVEDEILVRVTVAGYLRDAGYKAIEAADASEALAVFASGETVDVVFTDVQMPGAMNGSMLARWVGDHHPHTEVLVTSGQGDEAVSSGLVADDTFFPKPYRLEEVEARIRSIVEHCR